MDKGIRPFARNLFAEQNELRRRGLQGNTAFRKGIIATLMEEFGISLASAASHYNEAFKFVKELNAELVDGLGRAEDKKGGRKSNYERMLLAAGYTSVEQASSCRALMLVAVAAEAVQQEAPAVNQEVVQPAAAQTEAAVKPEAPAKNQAALYEELGAALM